MEFQAITDRTQKDIENREEKVLFFPDLLNRIETNITIIASLLNVTDLTIKTNWGRSDWYTPGQITRLLENAATLRAAYYVYHDTPELPDTLIDWEQFNSYEKVLSDLYALFLENQYNKIYCGETFSGQTIGVI